MKSHKNVSSIVGAVVFLFTGAITQAASADSITREQLKVAVARSREAVRSIYYEAEEVGSTVLMEEGVEARRKIRFAASGQLRFVDSAHEENGWPSDLDVDRSMSYFRGEALDIYWTAHRQLDVSRRNAMSHFSMKSRFDLLVEATGWWPIGDPVDKLPEGFWSEQLLHVLVEDQRYSIAREEELVDGHRCTILRDGVRDILWLGHDVGYAVVRREQARHDQIPFRIYRNSNFNCVGRDVWLPMHFARQLYSDRPTEGGTLFGSVERSITRVLINESIPKDIFILNPPPGTVIRDLDNKTWRRLPGGEDLLDETAATAKTVFSDSLITPHAREVSWPKIWTYTIMAGNGVLIAAYCIAIMIRRRPLRSDARASDFVC